MKNSRLVILASARSCRQNRRLTRWWGHRATSRRSCAKVNKGHKGQTVTFFIAVCVIASGRPYNQKSDIWSLGCILYEMCALKRAFEAPTLPALVLKIMRGLYQPLPSHFSPALKDLVSSMLELDPGRRPTLAAVMAHPWLAPHLYRLPTTLGALPCTAKPPRPLSRSEDLDMIGRESPYLRRRTPSPFQR